MPAGVTRRDDGKGDHRVGDRGGSATWGMCSIQVVVRDLVRSNRFLLVLDNVWCEDISSETRFWLTCGLQKASSRFEMTLGSFPGFYFFSFYWVVVVLCGSQVAAGVLKSVGSGVPRTPLSLPVPLSTVTKGDRGAIFFRRRFHHPPPLSRPVCRREGAGGRTAGWICVLLV